MKFLSVILSFYVLMLTFVPCADAHANIIDSDCISFVQEQDSHSHSDNEADLCSPFCYCTCCQSVSQLEQTSLQTLAPISQSIDVTIIVNSFTSPVIGFWRPPKI